MKARNEYFDFLRGIAIIMVIGIHTLPTLTEYNSVGSMLTITTRQLLNCAVPLFLAISGYFIAKKDLSTAKSRIQFWRKQIPIVYIPCFIFSLGWLALDLLKHGTSNIWMELIALVTCGYSIYYFIALIIQFYLIAPWLLKINKWEGGVFLCAIPSGISILGITYMLQIEGKTLPIIVYAGPFVLWIIFYMLGIWFSTHSRKYPLKLAWIIIIIGLVASVIETKYYLPIHGGGLGIKFSSFVFSAGIIMLLFSEKAEKLFRINRLNKALVFIGEISFGVYLLHIYVCVFLIRLCPTQIWIINWTATLAITILLIMVAKKILPQRFATKYLGFR